MGTNLIDHIDNQLNDVKDRELFVAVSGGIDSMVLLHSLRILQRNPTVLHVNYNLRGKESKGDQKFIEDYCKAFGIPCKIKEVDLAKRLEEKGGNLQQIARKVRYDWFQKILGLNTNGVLLLAHHQDDQIETFFLQALRGAGILGLASMPEINGNYLRPLLRVSRNEIKEFAKSENIIWREDSSNQSLKYNRNKLRHELIPLMESNVQTLKDDVLTLVSIFQDNYKLIRDKVSSVARQSMMQNAIAIEWIQTLNDEELAELMRQLNLPIQLRNELRKLTTAENNKRMLVSASPYDFLVKTNNLIRLVRVDEMHIEPILKIERVDHIPSEFDKTSVYLDADKIDGKLLLRRWKESDRIASIGVPGSQLISRILHDRKVLPEEREKVYVLTDSSNVLWCPGYKIGRTAIAEAGTKSILKCSIIYKGSEE